MNVRLAPISGAAFEGSKAATTGIVPGVEPATITVFEVVALTPLRPTVSVTVNVPCAAYFFEGFCSADDVPSPKLHCHDAGPPPERSVNWIVSFVVGFAGAYMNCEESAPLTVTLCV